MPAHVGGGDEIADCLGDVFRFAQPGEWNAVDDGFLFCFARCAFGPEDGAGGDAVDPHFGCQVQRQGAGQSGQSGLGRDVGRVIAHRAVNVNVDQVDDYATAFFQVRCGSLDQEIRTTQVAAQKLVPLCLAGTAHRRGIETGRIVHQRIQLPPGLHHFLDHGCQGGDMVQVGAQGQRRARALFIEFVHQPARGLRRAVVVHGHIHARGVQDAGGGRAQPPPCAGYQGDPAAQPRCCIMPHAVFRPEWLTITITEIRMPRLPDHQLPAPPPEAQAHSARLAERLRAAIEKAGGWIPFEHYMDLALYAPGLGYYSAGAQKFGAAGDFVTAPEISALFGRCVARQCHDILAQLEKPEILELGAGTGLLAVDILSELESLNLLPERYRILEVSAELRGRQYETLANRVPHLLDRVSWLERLPETPIEGVILGNEVLDALPVAVFEIGQGGPRERGVSLENGAFVWALHTPRRPLVRALSAVEKELGNKLPKGYRSELCLRLPAWITALAETLERGVMLLSDYGLPRRELYLPERNRGTLLCHYRHRAHEDVFFWPGLQDLTAWVDFTAVGEAALAADLDVLGYTTQAHFLLGAGLNECLWDLPTLEMKQQAELTRQARQLVLPEEMGEKFKFIALGRGIDPPLRGFSVRDLRDHL